MTDRHAGYIVTLAEDVREDDAQEIITALRRIRGVISVDPVVSDPAFRMAQQRARADISSRLLRALTDDDAAS